MDRVYVTRNSICSRRNLVILVVDTQNGTIWGEALATVEQQIDTKNTSVEYSEYMNFHLVESDITSSAMTISVNATCSLDNSCRQDSSPWGDPRPITVGGSIDGTWTRSWIGNQGHKEFRLSYDLYIHISGTTGGNTEWGGDEEQADGQYWVRCDNEVGTYAGCVQPDFTPTFVVNEKYSAARNFIASVQENMATHPGWEGNGQPLHRESDADEEGENRRVICKDGSFKADPDTPDPTCDEYPFARSKESGRQLGVTTGAECQQYWVEARVIGGQEYLILFNVGDPPADAKCGRASMPKSQNTGVGGDLGRKTVQWRLLENDSYWVDAGAGNG